MGQFIQKTKVGILTSTANEFTFDKENYSSLVMPNIANVSSGTSSSLSSTPSSPLNYSVLNASYGDASDNITLNLKNILLTPVSPAPTGLALLPYILLIQPFIINSGFSLDSGDGDDRITINHAFPSGNVYGTLFGGAGNDRLAYTSAMQPEVGQSATATENIYMDGGTGNDNLQVSGIGTGSTAVLHGGSGGDWIAAVNVANAEIWGGDLFNTDTGNDTIILSASANAYVIANGGNDLILSVGTSSDFIMGLGGNDNISSGAGNDSISGDTGNDTLSGGDGNDSLFGGTGSDTLSGGNGNDSLDIDMDDSSVDGGSGVDMITSFVNNSASVIDLVAGTITSQGKTVTVKSVENFQLNNTGQVSFVGDNQDNQVLLSGIFSNDVLYGADGHDRLNGGGGNDQLYGGNGNDTLEVSYGSDVLVGAAGSDTFRLASFLDTAYFLTSNVNKTIVKDFDQTQDKISFSAAMANATSIKVGTESGDVFIDIQAPIANPAIVTTTNIVTVFQGLTKEEFTSMTLGYEGTGVLPHIDYLW